MGETGKTPHPDDFKTEYQETGNACYAGEVKTAFATEKDINQMKDMVKDAKPELVLDVADAWQKIHDKLVDGGGSVKTDFDKAVEHVLQHWEGESADEFAKKAKKVSKQIADCATYARYTSTAMRNAGHKLAEIKPKVDAIEKPGDVSSAMNALGDGFSRNDDKWRGEIKGNQGAQKALDGHDDDLSAGKEEQLKAAAHMETLALAYSSQTKTMGSWAKTKQRDSSGNEDYPGAPGGVAPVPVPMGPDGSGPSGGAVGGGRASVPGGSRTGNPSSPGSPKGTPATGAKVDGITGGAPATKAQSPTGAGSVPGGIGSGGAGGAGGGAVGGGVPGGGMLGRGGAGAAAAARGAAGAGAGAGKAGAAGARGGLGSGMGNGAGGKGLGKGAGSRGPLARQRGGALDTPEGGKSASRQGGSSLHSSRGGAQAGQRGRNANGMLGGGLGSKGGRAKDEENSRGQRPDYLVEDEETWMPERRDVTPPTIG